LKNTLRQDSELRVWVLLETISLMLRIRNRREGEKHQLSDRVDSLQIKMRVDSNLEIRSDDRRINTLTGMDTFIILINNGMTIM